ncbi:hypothetical protein, partial [Endozoicomonas sp. SESOKO4]
KIEENEPLKSTFIALLATSDLTVMYDDNREAVSTAFKKYSADLSGWLALYHSISAASANFLGETQKANFHLKQFGDLKKISSH